MLRDRDFCAQLNLATIGPMSGASQKGEVCRAFSNPDFLAILGFATTPARAQGTWLETRLIRSICSSKATPAANTDRLAKRLKLTDPQKAALKDLADASASPTPRRRRHYALTSQIFLRRSAEWLSPKRWRRPSLPA